MDYTLEFSIDGLPPLSANGSHGHWAVKAATRRRWRMRVVLAVGNKRPPEPLMKAKLTVTRFSAREPDFDNLVASVKPLIDGLVDARVLHDDKPSIIGRPDILWQKAKPSQGRVVIRVEASLNKGDL